MNLYQIDAAILALCDPETGEVTDMAALEDLQMARDEKIENVALWVKNLNAEVEALKTEIVALTERKKSKEAMVVRRMAYLSGALAGQKFETARCKVTFRPSSAVELDEGALEWLTANMPDCIKTKPEISKTAVSAAIKAGAEIPVARIIEKLNVGVK